VQWRGQSIGGKSSRAIARRGISRTFQHVKMIPEMTVLENVALGGYGRSKSGVLQAVLRLDRAEERQLFAEAEAQLARIGITDRLHELAGNLALGPQRLMEIARALATEPALLLLDEPAAGLNAAEQADLAVRLRALARDGLTLLVIEHNMPFLMPLAGRMACLDYGRLIASGTPAEIRAHPRVIEAYLGTAQEAA
jgi:branched-chain amino acid transport system permease protein